MSQIFKIASLSLLALIPDATVHASERAQSPDPDKSITQHVHEVWQFEEGLPQNTVQAITQTSDGYLWLGTEEGLARYDGAGFTVFDRGNSDALARSHNILSLLSLESGDLLVGTSGGGLVQYSDGEVQPFAATGVPERASISDMLVDADGRLWIATWNNGVFSCEMTECTSFGPVASLSGKRIQALARTADGGLWLGTEKGLIYLDSDGRVSSRAPELSDASVHSLLIDSERNLWVGTNRGVYTVNKGEVTYKSPDDGWPEETVWSLWQDGNDSIWLGLDQSGLLRLAHGRLDSFRTEDGLTSGRVLSLFEDTEGSLWIGTAFGGLNRIRDAAFTTWSTREGLSDNTVTTMAEDAEGNVWVGTYGSGISVIGDGKVEFISTENGLSSNAVTSLTRGQDDVLWAGTMGGGLNRIGDGSLRHYTMEDGLVSNDVYGLFEASDHSLWVGTSDGVSRMSNGTFTSFTTSTGLSDNSVTAVAEDQDGTIWVGTYNGGLNVVQNDEVSRFEATDLFEGNPISAIHVGSDGALWIGTYGSGLFRVKDDEVRSISTRQGLYDDNIFQLLQDGTGHLWMGCNRGVFRVALQNLNEVADGDKERVSYRLFGTADGLKSPEVNGGVQPAGLSSSDGRLWFPTVAGAAVVDPDNLKPNTTVPPVVIERVIVDNVPVSPDEPVVVPPGTKRVEIRYAGLSLIDPSAVRYRYMMQGYENDWVIAGDQRVASFTHLDPGDYTFHVTAMNNDGVWRIPPASLSFSVQPYFYEYPLFWTVGILLILGLAVFSHRVHVRNLTARKKELEEMVDQRTADVRQAMDKVEAKSTALRNSLREKDILLREVHHRVKNNLQMISSLLQLQARKAKDEETEVLFQACRDRIYSISMVHERLYKTDDLADLDFSGYLESISEQLVKSYNMENRVDVVIDADNVKLAVDHAISCGLIATELISNAMKHAFPGDRKGTIRLSLDRSGSNYELIVADDGVGMNSSLEFGCSQSLGLNLVRALTQKLRGAIELVTESTASGTVFRIQFPEHIENGSFASASAKREVLV